MATLFALGFGRLGGGERSRADLAVAVHHGRLQIRLRIGFLGAHVVIHRRSHALILLVLVRATATLLVAVVQEIR